MIHSLHRILEFTIKILIKIAAQHLIKSEYSRINQSSIQVKRLQTNFNENHTHLKSSSQFNSSGVNAGTGGVGVKQAVYCIPVSKSLTLIDTKVREIQQQEEICKRTEDLFFKVLGEKIYSHELTFIRFKQTVDLSLIAIGDKIKNIKSIVDILRNLEINDNSESLMQNQIKEIDELLSDIKNWNSKVCEIIFKINQMKNKESIVSYGCSMEELGNLQKNIDKFIN